MSGILVGAMLLAAPSAFGLDVLKNMMKSLELSANRGDARATAIMFETTAAMGPPEFAEWKEISKKGAKAARRGDLLAVKAACKSCHEKYQDTYKTKYGSAAPPKPIPGLPPPDEK